MFRGLLLSLIIFSTSFAQVEYSKSRNQNLFGPGFNIDLANYPGDELGKTRMDVFIQVPYSNIQFVKNSTGFKAKYTITLTFYDEFDDEIIVERMWKEKIETESFDQAISGNNYNFSYRSFNLEPGEYNFRCEIVDEDSKKSYAIEATANVMPFDKPLQISDIILISRKVSTEKGERFIPNVSNRILNKDSTLSFFFEIKSDQPRETVIEYIINDKNEDRVYSQFVDKQLEEGTNFIDESINNINFNLGSYTLTVLIRDDDWDIQHEKSKMFKSLIFGFPSSITDLDKAIEQMTYIASNSEIDEITELDDFDDKLNKYKDYWHTKDPSPNTDENEILNEYYRRVDYANANFKNYFDGWKSDMGMIYIILGPPNNVERYPFEYDSKPYEIWDYYDINKRFVFVDQTGFGDYRLLNHQYGDWYRYRQ
ncbi:GWxTD domain-containing protein [Bacteroidota bacterium]